MEEGEEEGGPVITAFIAAATAGRRADVVNVGYSSHR